MKLISSIPGRGCMRSLCGNILRAPATSLLASASAAARSFASAMGVTKEEVEEKLTNELKPVHLEVIDTSGGCGASFDIEIASAQFEGKRLLERHRLVNTALADELKTIHALSIRKALTPQQWQEQQGSTKTAAQ